MNMQASERKPKGVMPTVKGASYTQTGPWEDESPSVLTDTLSVLSMDSAMQASTLNIREDTLHLHGSRPQYMSAITASQTSSQTVLDSFSINKLNFEKAGLYGRDKETILLLQIWKNLNERNNTREVPPVCCNDPPYIISKKKIISNSQESNNEDNVSTISIEIDRKSSADSRSTNHSNKILTIVQGHSGVGKSKLVSAVLGPAVEKQNGLFAVGKFDLKQIEVPFNGIIMAMDDLCDKILAGIVSHATLKMDDSSSVFQGETTNFKAIKILLTDELRYELPFLVTIFPKLGEVVGLDIAPSVQSQGPDENSSSLQISNNLVRLGLEQESAETVPPKAGAVGRVAVDIDAVADRLKHCVRRFFEVICTYRPLVIVCDDLQWADQESLDLLHQILTDDSNRGALMVVCILRSNEMNEDHKTSKFVQKIRDLKGSPSAVYVHSITIDNLTVPDLNSFLGELLSRDLEETNDLAVILHNKTQGNIFFVVQLLVALQQKGLLEFNFGLMKWIWSIDDVKERTPVAENVVDLVKEQLLNDAEANHLLPLAACIGSKFDRDLLMLLVEGFMSADTTTGNTMSIDLFLDKNLEHCQRKGYIDRIDSGNGYRFIHDRIQEAALAVYDADVRVGLEYQVGRILATKLPDDKLEAMVFTILGLLKKGIERAQFHDEEKAMLLNLNILAGKKAMSYSAFQPARNYFNAAIELLPEDAWTSDYQLTLDLYSCTAEAEYSVANFPATKVLCDTVMKEAVVVASDKLRVCNVLIAALVAQSKPLESIDMALPVLRDCGCKIPRGSLRVTVATVAGLFRTKFSRKMKSANILASVPISSDPTQAAVMKTLDRLATSAFVGKPEFFPVIVLKSLQWTFENGITVYSPAALALTGLLVTNFMDDFGSGWSYAEHALTILKRLKCKEVEARTVFLVYSYTAHWSHPMQSCMKPLLKGYKIGLSTGDIQSAMYCAFFFCEFCFHTGMALPLVDENMTMYSEQMDSFGQWHTLQGFKMIHQVVRILRGNAGSNDGTGAMLTGDIMEHESTLKKLLDAGDHFMVSFVHRYRFMIACYLGDYKTGADLAFQWTDESSKQAPGQPFTVPLRFCSALCCYATARMTGKRKYLKEGKRHHKLLRLWGERPKAHNPNCVHREMLLSAELDAFNGNSRSAYKKYESAVLLAGRRGIVHDQALANERFALYCLEQGDEVEFNFRMTSAVQLYQEWGCVTKVTKLKQSLKATKQSKDKQILGTFVGAAIPWADGESDFSDNQFSTK